MVSPKADILFELSWEVCNKVGGIYTVIKSKADLVKKAYKEYYLIGPYVEKKALESMIEKKAPNYILDIFNELEQEGIICHFGEWQIKGKPSVILIDVSKYTYKINDFKKRYWELFGIDSLHSSWTFEEPMLWSTAAGILIHKLACSIKNKRIVAHFHEWMAGFALLHLKLVNCDVGTVFTTHATMLGRTICEAGRMLYEEMGHLEPVKEAYNYGIQDKFLTEFACAKNADVFTTVSEITSIETEKLLGRKADVLLLNGLDMEKFPSFEELSVKHRIFRERIREFISYYFFPYYYFDIEQTILFFIVGRYEYKNKGIDLFVEALARLNEIMRKENSKKTVIAFFWIPREVHGAKMDLSQNKLNYDQLKHFVEENEENFKSKLIRHIMKCNVDDLSDPKRFAVQEGIFTEEFMSDARVLKLNFRRLGNPLITTHNMPDEQNDMIIKNLLARGLDNKPDDKVKVIFYPVYLSGIDGLIDLPYYDSVSGCHLGLFPSYYEPWGYTPLESAALGVPSLTTDIGGYGRFILSKGKGDEGVFVLKRVGRSEEEIISDFTQIMHRYTTFDEKKRVQQKIIAKNISNLADWNVFVNHYFEAHNLALERKYLTK